MREDDGGRGHQLGTRIRHQRWRDGVPRAALAETAGIELGRLVSMESGDSLISERELAAIAKAMTTSVDALAAPADTEPARTVPSSMIRRAMHSVLARYMARLDLLQTKRAV